MTKQKKSGSAIFMYWVIGITAVLAAGCFSLYYGSFLPAGTVLWTGVTAFTVMYHLWLRIILGNVTKLFPIHYSHPWFRQRSFEPALCRALQVKRWKGRALTYNPELFSLQDRSLEQIAVTMAKAETDHWVNELISLSTLLFAVIWGQFWIFAVTAAAAMLFDAQFIVIQRYNRPRVLRVMEKAGRAGAAAQKSPV